ncbi:MAG: hypothetical protein K8R36_09805 [Planctomycetales bacterium]|nr:hypothetical protein [Planctomycetales bacterium]
MPSFHPLTPILLALVLSLPSLAAAQERTPQQQAEVKELQTGIEDFFKGFTSSTIGPEQAFNTLVGKGPLKTKTEELTGLIDKASKLESRYGRYTGHDAASVKTVGNDLVILRYLYKAERFPVVWHFYYYRPASGGTAPKGDWNLIEIRFDTNLDGLDR